MSNSHVMIEFNYNTKYAVPIDKLSELLVMLEQCTLVARKFHNDKCYIFKAKNVGLNMELLTEILDEEPMFEKGAAS